MKESFVRIASLMMAAIASAVTGLLVELRDVVDSEVDCCELEDI